MLLTSAPICWLYLLVIRSSRVGRSCPLSARLVIYSFVVSREIPLLPDSIELLDVFFAASLIVCVLRNSPLLYEKPV